MTNFRSFVTVFFLDCLLWAALAQTWAIFKRLSFVGISREGDAILIGLFLLSLGLLIFGLKLGFKAIAEWQDIHSC